jgi:Domain of unknown function (DUF6265)
VRRQIGTGVLLLATAAAVSGAEAVTGHTFELAEGDTVPAATLDDLTWLVGSWDGECFDARCEEVWNPPSANNMVGLFKLYDDAGVRFYELMLLEIEDSSPVLKVRHFNADFSAWEDRADFVSFPLVSIEPEAIHFRGLSFYRRGPDRLDVWIALHSGDAVQEHRFTYRRAGIADAE